jgi:hypothetical protein
MTRRASRYDNDPDVNTRPDTVPGPIRFAEESLTALDAKVQRELAPYPSLQPLSDERTVNYGIVSPFSDARGHTPSNAGVELRSGTQHMLASTVPPPSRTRVKLDSATNEDALRTREHRSSPRAEEHRSSPRAEEHRSSPRAPDQQANPRAAERRAGAAAASLPPPAPMPLETSRKGMRTFLLGAVTAIVAAAVGASLGNGSLQGAASKLFGGTEAAPVLGAPVPAKPAEARPNIVAPAPAGAEPPPAAPAEASGVPVMSFQELPPTKQEAAVAEDPKQTKQPLRKRGTTPNRR